MARCDYRWPLLDPNEEDRANGVTHWCRLEPGHGDDVHVCGCGEIPVAVDQPPTRPVHTFTCPECGATSHHPNDARYGYCGRCHAFTGRGQ